MAAEDDKFVQDVLRRRGQVNIFDILRNNRRRAAGDAGSGGRQGAFWWISAGLAVLTGMAAVMPDILGGAGIDRIATTWMVISGLVFLLLIKIDRTLLALGAAGLVLTVGASGWAAGIWLSAGLWPSASIGDHLAQRGFAVPETGPAGWYAGLSPPAGLFLLSLAFLAPGALLGYAIRRLDRRGIGKGDQSC